jgi:hypothetical protein
MDLTADGRDRLSDRGEEITLLSGSDQTWKGPIQLGEVLGQEAIADANPKALLLPLPSFFQGEQDPEIPNPWVWVLIVQALALGDEIGHIGGILGIVFIPAAIEELAIPLHGYPGDQDDLVSLPDQMLSQGLMVVGGGLQAKDHLREAMLNL